MSDDLHSMTRAELLSSLQLVEDETRRVLLESDGGTATFVGAGLQLKGLNARGAELLSALRVLEDATAPIEEVMRDVSAYISKGATCRHRWSAVLESCLHCGLKREDYLDTTGPLSMKHGGPHHD